MLSLDLALALAALGVAAWLRPWRCLPESGLPWPSLLVLAFLPALWNADRLLHAPLVQPLSGACLLLLMVGWPLAVLGFVPVAAAAAWLGHLPWGEALHRGVWLGLLPATLALVLGAAVRRWLPGHLMVYILGRAFFVTLLAGWLTGALALVLQGGVPDLSDGELLLGRWLAAWGEALITGMLGAIFVAFRPLWLATYNDRLYLPH